MNKNLIRAANILDTGAVVIALLAAYRIFILHNEDNDWLFLAIGIIMAVTLPVNIMEFRSGEGKWAKWLKGRRIWVILFLIAAILIVGYGAFNSLKFSAVIHEMEKTKSAPDSSVASTDFNNIKGQYPASGMAGETKGAKAPVGSCVNLSGPQGSPTLTEVECGSAENNYRVIQRVSMPNECVADSDRRYYQNAVADEWAVCLDLAWTNDSCLSVQRDSVLRVACNDTSKPRREKPLKVLLDSTTSDNCPSGGFAHPVRRFTVCTETQR